jgi:Tol biopolymer transport system component
MIRRSNLDNSGMHSPRGTTLPSPYASGRFAATIRRGGWKAALARLGVAALLAGGLVAVTGGLAGAPPALAGPARAATPTSPGAGHAGRIVWTQVLNDRFSSARIVSARPDGSGLRALTHPGAKTFDVNAVISPDGSQVVFERNLPNRAVVGMVGATGRGEHIVPLPCASPCAGVANPSWTPDGRRIVFTRVIGPFDGPGGAARSAVLYTARPDGTGMRRLSPPGIDGVYEDGFARFAASGKYLIFARNRNQPFVVAIFRMRPDGSHVQRLTPWRLNADVPDLSLAAHGPTKDLVVFETFAHGPPKGAQSNIATVPATCHPLAACLRDIRYVTHNVPGPHTTFNPAWSPDGKQIAFTNVIFSPDRPPIGDIWTMRRNGHARQRVSPSSRFEYRPDWGPAPPELR